MKWSRRFLYATASLLALTAPARADFVLTPIALALFAGPLGGVLSVNAIYAGLQIALVAGLAVGSALLQRQKQKVDPGQVKSNFETSDGSEINAIGRVGIGGLKVFGNTAGSYKDRVIAHSATILKAAEEYRLGGREVTREDNGDVSSPPYAKPDGSWVTWLVKDGTGTDTAWAGLVSRYPTLWTSDHTLPGIANSLLTFVTPGFATNEAAEKHQRMYGGGELEGAIVGRWDHVYDPREEGADPDDEDTYVWSMNGPLCAARIMSRYPDLTMASFDWDFIAAEADKADVLVDTLTGTEPRSQCSGVWFSEANRGDTMADVLESIGAEIVMSDEGLIRIRLIDDVPTAEVSFSDADDDIVEWSWQAGPEAIERPNVCRIKFYSAERNYEMADLDMSGIAWARIEDEITRYGEKYFDVDLPFCPSASQAQRIARRLFLLARADTGVVITNWVGTAAWGLVYGEMTFSDLEETILCRIETPKIDDKAGLVEIPFVSWPQDLIDIAWDPATMEAAAPEQLPDLQSESELDTPDAPTEATVVQYPGGGAYETRTKFAGVTGGTIAEANYRTYTGGLPNAWQSMTEYQGVSEAWYGWATDDISGDEADFRARFFNAEEEGSYFSDLYNVASMAIDNTTPGAPTASGVDTGAGPYAIEVTARAPELRVVKMVVEEQYTEPSVGFAWRELETWNDVRPDVNRVVSTTEVSAGPDDATLSWRVSSYTSDGTQGPYTSGSRIIAGTGGP